MGLWQKGLNRFSIFDLVVIAMLSSLGIAIKPIVAPLSHILLGALPIPPGAVTGGIYMMWLVLGFGITQKRGTMTLIGLVQGILVMAVGMFGSQGALSLLTYTIPGLAADLAMLLIGHRACCLTCSFIAGMICNIAGTAMVNLTNYRFPLIPLILSLGIAALSGGIGGMIVSQLDAKGKKTVTDVIKQLRDTGKTIIMAEHDLNGIAFADRFLELRDGKLKNHEI